MCSCLTGSSSCVKPIQIGFVLTSNLQEQGYVTTETSTVGKTLWSLSVVGVASVKTCWKLLNTQPLLKIRDEPFEEMSRYELICHLEKAGWQMQVASSAKNLSPFMCGGSQPLVWFLKKGQTGNEISVAYLRLLLTAAEHGRQIPHLCQPGRYNQLLNGEVPPALNSSKRKPSLQLECDDWGLLVPVPKPKRKRARKQSSQADKVLALLDINQDELLEPVDSLDAGSDVQGPALAPSVSHHSIPHDTQPANAFDPGEFEAIEPNSSKESESSSSSSSSSDSSSSSTSENVEGSHEPSAAIHTEPEEVQAKAKFVREPVAATQPRIRTFQGEAWGVCLLTPRYKAKVLTGLQMHCSRPEHNLDKKRCTKELSFGVAGDEATCRRMLKSWIVFASSVSSRDERMFETWKLIQVMKRENGLPSEDDLNLNVVHDWESYHAVEPVKDVPPQLSDNAFPGILGPPAKGVPEAVHAHMEHLAANKVIPVTLPAQRARNKCTAGTSYGVPAWLADARRYGYIHPNLPAPQGCVWRFTNGNTWTLCTKGG